MELELQPLDLLCLNSNSGSPTALPDDLSFCHSSLEQSLEDWRGREAHLKIDFMKNNKRFLKIDFISFALESTL